MHLFAGQINGRLSFGNARYCLGGVWSLAMLLKAPGTAAQRRRLSWVCARECTSRPAPRLSPSDNIQVHAIAKRQSCSMRPCWRWHRAGPLVPGLDSTRRAVVASATPLSFSMLGAADQQQPPHGRAHRILDGGQRMKFLRFIMKFRPRLEARKTQPRQRHTPA
jgi:hypothetical protein